MASNEERIRQRAYEIWEQEGRPDGEDMRHWLLAFQEIAANAEGNGQPAKNARSKKVAAANASPKSKAKTKPAGGAQSVPTTTPPPQPAKAPRGATKH